MEYRCVSNRYIVTQTGRVGATHHVNHTPILNVRSSAHAYAIDVTSNYGVHPNATVGSYNNVTNDLSTLINKRRLCDTRVDGTKWTEH